MKRLIWPIAAAMIFTLSSCGVLMRASIKPGIRATVPLLAELIETANRSGSIDTMKAGVPAHLILIDGLISLAPGDAGLLTLAAKINFAYAMGFIQDENPRWAKELYLKGRDYGLDALKTNRTFAKALDGGADFADAVAHIGEKDLPALFWTGNNWAGWLSLNMKDPMALFDMPKIRAIMDRVIEIDDTFFYGGAHLFYGVYYAGIPAMMGGGPEKAAPEFDRVFEIAGDRFLMAKVYYAQYFARAKLDRDLYIDTLEAVLDMPADAEPDLAIPNEMARRKASALLEEVDELPW